MQVAKIVNLGNEWGVVEDVKLTRESICLVAIIEELTRPELEISFEGASQLR